MGNVYTFIYIYTHIYIYIYNLIIFIIDVVFGEVVSGMDIVMKIESFGSSSGKPKKQIKIIDSGEL